MTARTDDPVADARAMAAELRAMAAKGHLLQLSPERQMTLAGALDLYAETYETTKAQLEASDAYRDAMSVRIAGDLARYGAARERMERWAIWTLGLAGAVLLYTGFSQVVRDVLAGVGHG